MDSPTEVLEEYKRHEKYKTVCLRVDLGQSASETERVAASPKRSSVLGSMKTSGT